MSVIRTYHILKKKINHHIPTGHTYRERNLGWIMTGIFHSNSVHTSKIANKIPGKAKRSSRSRRISRFFDNGQVRVRHWYHPVATQLLWEAAKAGGVRLIIDGTKVTNGHQLLMVALAYRHRALPIAWTWVRSGKGHSSGHKQAALLSYVHDLMPDDAIVVVVGDSEFTPLQALLEDWDWYYALRQKGSHLYRLAGDQPWQRVDSLVTKPGQRRWLTDIELTQEHKHACNFFADWRRGEKQPWLISTNLPTARETNKFYSRRMWIEEMFGDFKSNGADLESSRLQHFLRLSRLTLVVALLYVWVVTFGASSIKQGKRDMVDRTDRRDLSIYRIGYDMFERCLINQESISIGDVPYFT
jgi:hypothetical protein